MKSYRAIPLSTKNDCLASEYSYALELSFEPTIKDLDLIRELSKESKFILSRKSISENSSIFGVENLEKGYVFNTLVFGDMGLNNINFIIKFYKPQETVSASGDIIKSFDIIVNINSTVSDGQISDITPSLTIEGIKEESRIGLELYKFKPRDFTITKESYQKFTSRVNQLVSDNDMAMLMGECGVSTSRKNWSFWIKEEEEISGFDKIGICVYSEDLCVLKYNLQTHEYSLSSLTKSGPYGNLDYKVGYISVPDSSEYYGIYGSNIIYTTDDFYLVYSIYNLGKNTAQGYKIKKVINNYPNLLITSSWLIGGGLEFLASYDLFNRLESLTNLKFFQERDEFLGSLGGKYKIRFGNKSEIYYFDDLGYTIDNTENIIWINENLMLYREKENITFIPRIYDLSRVYKEDDKILISNEEDHNQRETFTLFNPMESLDNHQRIILDGPRKKPWKTQFPKLDSIIPFRGLIFYTENDKLLLY